MLGVGFDLYFGGDGELGQSIGEFFDALSSFKKPGNMIDVIQNISAVDKTIQAGIEVVEQVTESNNQMEEENPHNQLQKKNDEKENEEEKNIN